MAEKAIVFIDGGWLYRCRTALFSKLGAENFEIDYSKLPHLLCEDVANALDEDVSLVRTMYFGTIPSVRSGFNTAKQSAFYDFLAQSCNYDTSIHEVDIGGGEEGRSGTSGGFSWVDVSLATNLVYFAVLPGVMDVAIVVGDSPDIEPAIRRVRHLGKRVQLVSVHSDATSTLLDLRPHDFAPIYLDDHAAEMRLVRETIKRICKQCGREEETTWAGTDFFCSQCRGRHRSS